MKKIPLKYIKTIGLGLLIGVLLTGALFGVKVYLHGKLLPGTTISGINLGYKTKTEAVEIMKKATEEYMLKPLIFEAEIGGVKKIAEIIPAEIDLQYFVEESVNIASKIDFKTNPLPYALTAVAPKDSENILYTFDRSKLENVLIEKFEMKELLPRNASYVINKGQVEVVPEKEGIILDTESRIQSIKNALGNFQSIKEKLEFKKVIPTVSKESLEEKKETMTAKIKAKIKLTYENKKWTFAPGEQIDMIVFARTDKVKIPFFGDVEFQSKDGGAGEVYAFLNAEKFNQYVEENIAKEIEKETEPVSIYKDIETQKIKFEGRGLDGVKIQKGHLKKSLELALNEQVAEVKILTEKETAPVTISEELQEMGIKELIGTGYTTFYGSPGNRVHNIGVGMDTFNGMTIAPGEEFSFNKNIGRVDGTTGYRKELTITQKGTIPEYGGGLCQVSSTMYRAALFSGLPITARAPHSYAVSYYSQILGHGLDATVYIGGQDLKFMNDTGYPILIHAFAFDGNAYFKFYGTSDGREVEMEGPYISNRNSASTEPVYIQDPTLKPGEKKQIEAHHPGLSALWYRYITNADGTETKETISSKYRATQNKYLIGPQ